MVESFPQEPGEHHYLICETALKIIQQLSDGNGLTPDQITLQKHDTRVFPLHGAIHVTLEASLRQEEFVGNNPQGEIMESVDQMERMARAGDMKILTAPETVAAVESYLDQDPGIGWGMEQQDIKLRHANKTYCVMTLCPQCSGKTWEQCTWCKGTGHEACTTCFGHGNIQKNDGTNTVCHVCNGTQEIVCIKCRGDGRKGCTVCRQTGAFTHVCHTHYDAVLTFVPNTHEMTPDIQEILNAFDGRTLVTEKHMECFRNPPVADAQGLQIPLMGYLPAAEAVFMIAGKETTAVIAGLQGRVLKIDPFLDSCIKPGIQALMKITKGPMATTALIETACRYRVLAHILYALGSKSRNRVYHDFRQSHTPYLSEKFIKGAVKFSYLTLHKLGNLPRLKGLAGGIVIASGIFGGYFFAGGRLAALKAFPPYIPFVDIGTLGLGIILSYALIRYITTLALQRILPDSIAPDTKHLAPAAEYGIYAAGALLIIWLGMAMTGPSQPVWLLKLLAQVGI